MMVAVYIRANVEIMDNREALKLSALMQIIAVALQRWGDIPVTTADGAVVGAAPFVNSKRERMLYLITREERKAA